MAFVDLCRLCGSDTLNTVQNRIFEGEGRVKKYALKISECLSLQVRSLSHPRSRGIQPREPSAATDLFSGHSSALLHAFLSHGLG
jgi:hypothetical protein